MNNFLKWCSIWTLFLVGIVALSALACTHRAPLPTYAWALDSLKKEVLSNPSQVTASYDSMMAVIGTASDRVSRESQLYLMLAKIRNDEPCVNDSLAGILVQEFSSSTPLLQSLALYINGMTHLELGGTKVALQQLYKAKDVSGVKAFTRQYVRVCLAISQVYTDKGMYKPALALKFEAVEFTKRAQDYEYLSHSYRDIANTFEFVSKIDSASIFFQKAFYYARVSGSRRALYYLNLDYARLLLTHDSLSKAKQIMDTISIPKKQNILESYYANKIRCLYLEQKYDSCLFYCELENNISEPTGRLMAYGYAYRCGIKTNDTAAALEALQNYTNLDDSLFDIHKVEEIRKIRNKYDYLLAKKDKEETEKYYLFMGSAIIFVALLVVFGLYSILQRQRMHNLKREKIMKARLKLRQFRYEKSVQSLEDKMQEVEHLQHKLEDVSTKESTSELELTTVRKELAEMTVRLKSLEMTESQMEEKCFIVSPAYRKVVSVINNRKYEELELADWKAFELGCQRVYPTLFAAMSEFSFSMSADEVKVCYLTRVGVSPSEIGRLTFKSASAVSKCKTRIYGKLMNKKGGTAAFDELILSL